MARTEDPSETIPPEVGDRKRRQEPGEPAADPDPKAGLDREVGDLEDGRVFIGIEGDDVV